MDPKVVLAPAPRKRNLFMDELRFGLGVFLFFFLVLLGGCWLLSDILVRNHEQSQRIEGETQKHLPFVKLEALKFSKGYSKIDLDQKKLLTTFQGKIRNTGSRPLKSVEVTIFFKDNEGNIIGDQRYPAIYSAYLFGHQEFLKPNDLHSFGFVLINPPLGWNKKNYEARVTLIEFQD